MNPSPASQFDPAHTRVILARHRPFMVIAALAIGGLFGEEAWAAARFWPHLSSTVATFLGLIIFLDAFGGNLIALLLPSLVVRPENYTRPVGAFFQAFALGAGISIATSAVDLLLLLGLTGFSFDAAYVLLKDVYAYTFAVILIHGLVYYVRHMHWLYDEFGAADSPLKPIAASGGLAALIFIVAVIFIPMDVQGVNAAPEALRGLTGLHLYGRDLYLLSLTLGAYAWHMRWIADH